MRSLMMLSALAILMAPAGDDAGSGGSGAPAGGPPAGGGQQQQDPAKPPPSGDQEEKIPLTRKELDAKLADRADRAGKKAVEALIAKYKDDGVTSEEELEKIVKAHKANAEAQKSELQKERERATKAEKDAEAAKLEAAAAREDARRVRVFGAAGVKDADYVGFLLDKAKTEEKDLNEKEWLEQLKKDKPVLFGQPEEPPKANSGRRNEGTQTGNGKAGNVTAEDLMKLPPDQRRAAAVAAGVNPRLIGL